MQDAEYNLQRAYLPGTSVNEGNKKQCIWGCVASQMLLLMCEAGTQRGEQALKWSPSSEGRRKRCARR
jgi:hypothetical protein